MESFGASLPLFDLCVRSSANAADALGQRGEVRVVGSFNQRLMFDVVREEEGEPNKKFFSTYTKSKLD